MKFFTNLTKNAEEETQEKGKDAENNVNRRIMEEDPRRGYWSEKNDLHVEYVPTQDQQSSPSGLLVTGLSHLKPVLLGPHSNADTASAYETILRILEILGQRKSLNTIDQQQLQQQLQYHHHKMKKRHLQKHHDQQTRGGKDGISDLASLRQSSRQPSAGSDSGKVAGSNSGKVAGSNSGKVAGSDTGKVPGSDAGKVAGSDAGKVPGSDAGKVPGSDAGKVAGSDAGKVPTSTIAAYVSKLLAKPKLRDDLLRRMTATMGLEGITKTHIDDALRQILTEYSKADRDQRQMSGSLKSSHNQSPFQRAGYGYRSKGNGGEMVGVTGMGNDLSVVGDQIYSGVTQMDPDSPIVRNDPDQNLASSGTGRTSPGSELQASGRYSGGMTSDGRPRHRRMSRRNSRGRRRRSSAREKDSKDSKKRKSSTASSKGADRLSKTMDGRKSLGSGSEATPVDENLLHRLSKGTVLKGDEDKAGTPQGKSDEMRLNAPSALTKGVASDSADRRPASSPPTGPTSGDLLGSAAARSPTSKDGVVSSAAPPSQGRWADVVGKDAGAVTMATMGTPQGGADQGSGLTKGVGKSGDGGGKRPSSSPVKSVGKGSARTELRQSANAKTSKTGGDFQQHGDFESLNAVHPDDENVGSTTKKDGITRKDKARGGSGRGGRGNNNKMSMQQQSSAMNPPPPPPLPWTTDPTNEGETKGGRAPLELRTKSGLARERSDGEHGPGHADHHGPDSAFGQGSGSDNAGGRRLTKDFGDSTTGVVAHRVSIAARQDGESHIQSTDESPAILSDELGRTDTQIETWSISPTLNQSSPVVPPPLFLARGDNYGLPGKSYELTRAFVFSYSRRMPPHYIDFKNNPPSLAMTKKKNQKNNKRKN